MSYCAYCGTKLTEGAKFCLQCGEKVISLQEEDTKDLEIDNDILPNKSFDIEGLLQTIKESIEKGEFSRLSIVNKNLYLNTKLLGSVGETPLYKKNTYILSLQDRMISLEKVQTEQVELFNNNPLQDGLYESLSKLYKELTETNEKIRNAEKSILKLLYLILKFKKNEQISELRKNVIDKLLEGDYSSSTSLLCRENIVNDSQTEESEQIKEYIENEQLLLWLLFSQGLHTNSEYEKRFTDYADRLIQNVIQPSSIDVCIDYWKEKKQSTLKEEYLQKLVDALEKRNYSRNEEYAWCCFYLSDSLDGNQKSEEALKYAKSALDIIHSFSNLTSDLKDLLVRCLNLLVLCSVNSGSDSVEKAYFIEALSVMEDAGFDDSYLKTKIIGNHFYATEQLGVTDDYYHLMYTVVDILSKYAEIDPYGYEEMLADQKRYLSACCARGKITEKDGIAESKEAVNFAEKLFEKNPPTFSLLLLFCMMNMADSYSKKEDYSNAIDCYRKALSKLEVLIPLADEKFINNIICLYSCLALNYEFAKKEKEAIETRYKEIDMQKYRLVRADNESMDGLAYGYRNLGSLYEREDFSKSETYYKEACSIYNQLAEWKEEKYKEDLAYMYFRLGDLYKEYNQFEEARLYLEKAQTIYDFIIQKGLVDEFTKESAELVDRVLVILDATIKRNKETFGWDGEKLNPVKLWGTKGTFDEPSSELEQNALMGDPKAIFDLSISKDKKWEEREKSIKWMMYGGDLGYYLHYCRAAYSIIQEEELNRREFGPGASLHAIEKLDEIHIKLLAGFEKIKDEKMSKTAEGAICSVERELCINYLLMSGCCPKKYKENTVKMSLEMIRKCVSKFNSLNEGNFYEFYWYCIALLKMYIVNKEFVSQDELAGALRNMPKTLNYFSEEVYERGIVELMIGLMFGYGIGIEKNTNTSAEYYQYARNHGINFSGVLQDFDLIQLFNW